MGITEDIQDLFNEHEEGFNDEELDSLTIFDIYERIEHYQNIINALSTEEENEALDQTGETQQGE